MPASFDQEFLIDLKSGIVSNASPYDIGPRMYYCTNGVWGYRYPQVDTSLTPRHSPPHLLRVPTMFPTPDAAVTYGSAPAMFLDIGFIPTAITDRRKLIIGTTSATNFRLWEATTGNIIQTAGGVPNTTVFTAGDYEPGTNAYWAQPGAGVHITTGALFFSHPSAGKIYYILRSSTGNDIRSMTDDVGSPVPVGASALCVHLDRLWMAEGLNPTQPGVTYIFYTDPFDAETVRGDSFVSVPDKVKCMMPTVTGQIDDSGIPHLFVGGQEHIWVFDGDPSTNQAFRRQIAQNIGVIGGHAACNSEHGVFFVGTDYQIYLVPPNAQGVIPIGTSIADRINTSAAAIGNTGILASGRRASLCWFPPYLYFFPTGLGIYAYILDYSNPQNPTWWGPMNSPGIDTGSASDAGVSRSTTSTNGGTSPEVWTARKASTDQGYFVGFDRFTTARGAYPNGHEATRDQTIVTGYIHKPGHRVTAKRVTLITTQKNASYPWAVSATTDRWNGVSGVLNTSILPVLSNVVHSSYRTNKLLYTFQNPDHVTGNAVYFSIAGPTASQSPESQALDVQQIRVVVEFTQADT